jgi:hypothetical protein
MKMVKCDQIVGSAGHYHSNFTQVRRYSILEQVTLVKSVAGKDSTVSIRISASALTLSTLKKVKYYPIL